MQKGVNFLHPPLPYTRAMLVTTAAKQQHDITRHVNNAFYIYSTPILLKHAYQTRLATIGTSFMPMHVYSCKCSTTTFNSSTSTTLSTPYTCIVTKPIILVKI